MSFAITRSLSTRHALMRIAPWLAASLSVGVLVFHLATDLPRHHWQASAGEAESEAADREAVKSAAVSIAPAVGTAITCSMSPTKVKAAGLATENARIDRLAAELGVPGRIELNTDRRVEVRSRAPGFVRAVHVVLGQHVKRGQTLATIDSPDVGTARLNLRARQRELVTARIEAAWKSQVAEAVALIIPEITKGVDPEILEKEFADKPLGSFRATLLQPYAEYDIAIHEEDKTTKLRSQNVIGEHPAILAKHTRQGIQAKLYGAIETARFDAAQQKRLADQQLAVAESAVVDAGQRLRILGVSEDIQKLLDEADRAARLAKDEDVTLYRVEAPFDGSILTKSAVPSQRADPVDLLFTLADLNTVWVSASISESDVAKVPSVKGGPIRLSATAYPGRIFEAKLLSVGAQLDPLTRTVPILAEVDNSAELLRPGMFTRILLDAPASEEALTVPAAAVVEIEGRHGVFVPGASDAEHESFTLRPVEVGRQVGDRIVVKSGLKQGDVIVGAGAFVLKSELILQNTPDED
jgi:membrane fusion protein, heavy metal efflux system